jgi:hypothetical protein
VNANVGHQSMLSQELRSCEVFNAKVEELLQGLQDVHPHVPEFKAWGAGFRLLRHLDASKPVQLFHEWLTCNEAATQHIMRRDERFFLAEPQMLMQPCAAGTDFASLVRRMCDVWQSTSTANKSIIWQYLQVLVMLDQREHGR